MDFLKVWLKGGDEAWTTSGNTISVSHQPCGALRVEINGGTRIHAWPAGKWLQYEQRYDETK